MQAVANSVRVYRPNLPREGESIYRRTRRRTSRR